MKILFLVHTYPFPPDDGMRSTSYRVIKHIAKRHETALLCESETPVAEPHIEEMKKWCKRVEVVAHEPLRSPLARAWNMVFESTPFCVRQFTSQKFAKKLEQLISQERYDIVHLLSVNIAGHKSAIGKTPTLFFPHDSVSMQFYRNSTVEPNWLKKIYLYNQSRKMEKYEKSMIRQFTRTVMVSGIDRDWTLKFMPSANITVIAAGVDPEEFKPLDIEDKEPSLLFRGVMNFPPNVDSVLYFNYEILPLIQKEFPDVKFYIVGKSPVESVQKLHNGKNIIVTGRVDDLREYVARATVNICPMRIGSGIKNKVLEALSMARAVVATPLALDGISVEHGKHVFAAQGAKDFAQMTIDLLKNPQKRKDLGRAGRELILSRYGWSAIADRYDQLYKEMAGN